MMQQNLAKADAVWGYASEISSFDEVSVSKGPCLQLRKKNGKQSKRGLTHFETCLFATVLEDTLMKVYILGQCNSELRATKAKADMAVMLAKKYGIEDKPATDEFHNINLKDLNCVENRLMKLQADRLHVIEVLKDVYLELTTKRSCQAFTDRVCSNNGLYDALVKLTEVEANNKSHYRELHRQLRQQRNHIKSVTYDTNAHIENLKSQIMDATWTTEIHSRYVENWQRSRIEQQAQVIFDKETSPGDSIHHFKQKADQEQRVHAEIELLNSININETLFKVELWMQKYETDIEKIDIKVQRRRNDYENKYETRLKLEDMLEQHAVLAKNWLAYKTDCEQARLYQEMMSKAAVMVQAWWRGILVRQQLGPYKVVKRKGTQAKPGDKSGKKK